MRQRSANPARKNLAVIRAGEYEGLARKMADPAWAPDFGPSAFNARSGATVIGARDFLVAFNVNLNTTSTRRANAVAFDVREAGRPRRDGNPLTGKIVTDAQGTAGDGSGQPQGGQGDRLVHRRVRHRPGLDEPDRPVGDTAARGVR